MTDTPPPDTRYFHDARHPASQWRALPDGRVEWRMDGHPEWGVWDAACSDLESLLSDPNVTETTQP